MTARNQRRPEVLARDKGVCASCGRDTVFIRNALQGAQKILRAKEGLTWEEAWQRTSDELVKRGFDKLGKLNRRIPDLWASDHIVEYSRRDSNDQVQWIDPDTQERLMIDVNDLRNLQTLCLPCHKAKTATGASEDAWVNRQQVKSKPKPAPVKTASRAMKRPNVPMPGVTTKAWSL